MKCRHPRKNRNSDSTKLHFHKKTICAGFRFTKPEDFWIAQVNCSANHTRKNTPHYRTGESKAGICPTWAIVLRDCGGDYTPAGAACLRRVFFPGKDVNICDVAADSRGPLAKSPDGR
ncbi:hypothetical protein M514_13481 [Trichuris suis]|uniref:Uncharacterized protein n=1 Tax=Trichuris suis TaxID=68888 RepID=A0A085LL00_9BILA|nr:hypothetical protein M513_13481 [Trichuris suis]KFD61990.1 hypothetical protein M514_13481 [Trichuris suis]